MNLPECQCCLLHFWRSAMLSLIYKGWRREGSKHCLTRYLLLFPKCSSMLVNRDQAQLQHMAFLLFNEDSLFSCQASFFLSILPSIWPSAEQSFHPSSQTCISVFLFFPNLGYISLHPVMCALTRLNNTWPGQKFDHVQLPVRAKGCSNFTTLARRHTSTCRSSRCPRTCPRTLNIFAKSQL